MTDNLTIEDLKCCGNCCYRARLETGFDSLERCEWRTEPTESQMVCRKWEYDGVQNRGLE
jgi:hypothetical protein